MYCIVLYCVVLRCIALYCVVLYCIYWNSSKTCFGECFSLRLSILCGFPRPKRQGVMRLMKKVRIFFIARAIIKTVHGGSVPISRQERFRVVIKSYDSLLLKKRLFTVRECVVKEGTRSVQEGTRSVQEGTRSVQERTRSNTTC